MIINDKEAAARLASPLNLINRLSSISKDSKRNSAMSLFIPPATQKKELFNPFPPAMPVVEPKIESMEAPKVTLDHLLENHESQIKLGLAHDKALDLLNRSVDALSAKLDDVKADKLPSVISAASKTVESIRKERNEASKSGKDREVHYHFYTPEQKSVSQYEIIDVAT